MGTAIAYPPEHGVGWAIAVDSRMDPIASGG